jgi:transposase
MLSYWNLRITSAAMEGFNNKIRWLNKQAYGYRDIEYLKLKIFDLPKAKDLKL